jgi:hypothetical protein
VKLIPEARRWWRMLSMQFSALALVWLALPAEAQASVLRLLPWMTEERVAGLLVLLAMIGRLLAQPKVRE